MSLQAIDVWMGVCTAFVFGALVEFTFVNYMWRSQSISEGKQKRYNDRLSINNEKQRSNRMKRNGNSFFPCIDRQDSSIELNMVINFIH